MRELVGEYAWAGFEDVTIDGEILYTTIIDYDLYTSTNCPTTDSFRVAINKHRLSKFIDKL